jgi:hypothetical protein
MNERDSRREIGEALLRNLSRGVTHLAPGESLSVVSQRLRGAGHGQAAAPVNQERQAIDPDGDPLEMLSKEERAMIEGRPYLKRLFLSDIATAEAAGREERDRAADQTDRDRAHAQNKYTHEIAARVVAERAAARIK